MKDLFYLDENGQHVLTKLYPKFEPNRLEYFDNIENPIDALSLIESKVENGQYEQPCTFDDDVLQLFRNVFEFYGMTSSEGLATQELLTFYTTKKEIVHQRLLTIIGDFKAIKSFVPARSNQLIHNIDPNEDIIRCICGLFTEGNVIIQCSNCSVWQHTECTGADANVDKYLCEICDKRTAVKEIRLNDYTVDNYQCYLTLMRGDFQVRQFDTVYILRDIPFTADNESFSTYSPEKHTYKTTGKFEYNECDIFRVERLWKDDRGNRFVYGHHYLRPNETYHKPSHKFYRNELVRVPLYEKLPIELIMGRCWVLNSTTFCKGRPVDSEELHVYICDYRVDKTARIFTKIAKQIFPVSTKSYAFHKFESKLKILRNYTVS